jgi:hypothetical protein
MSQDRLDVIRFAVAAIPFHRSDVRAWDDIVCTFVNGRDLLDVVTDFERPMALRAGLTQVNSYAPPAADGILAPSRHWLGSPHEFLAFEGWAMVLTCGCGAWECGGLLARITLDADVVVWSEFDVLPGLEAKAEGQPVEEAISRAGLVFRFDRAHYEASLHAPDRIPWPYGGPTEARVDEDGGRASGSCPL